MTVEKSHFAEKSQNVATIARNQSGDITKRHSKLQKSRAPFTTDTSFGSDETNQFSPISSMNLARTTCKLS